MDSNILKWCAHLDGLVFLTARPLLNMLDDVRLEHLNEVSPDFNARDLFYVLREAECITESSDGLLHVNIPRKP